MSYWDYTAVPFSTLNGLTIHKVDGLDVYNDLIVFHTSDGVFRMFHSQDCCERVMIEDITGSVEDLVGAEVISASEDCGEYMGDEGIYESATWTFYNIQTTKGHVQIRWLGVSNGYYSEHVSFVKVSDGRA